MRKTAAPAIIAAGVVVAASWISAQDHPSHQISNGEITATVYLPDARNGFYRSTRFDWSGAIGSLQYKGHEFYGRWFTKVTDIFDFGYEGPDKDVISAEFTAMVGPAEQFGQIGYNEVAPGGLFIVPGVGALRRDEGTYQHSRTFDIVNGGTWDVTTGRNSVAFVHTLTEPSVNFGYVYRKTITLTPGRPQMVLSHVMRNTGSRPIATTVYNHNFTTIGMQPTGPDVRITVPWQMTRSAGRRGGAPPGAARGGGAVAGAAAGPGVPAPGRGRQGGPIDAYAPLAAGETMGTQCGNPVMQTLASPQGNTLVYNKVLEGAECFQASFTGFSDDVADHEIRIENTRLGVGVLIKGDRPMTRFGYWSIRTVVAPEPFIALDIAPGEEFTWSYTYDYYTTR